MLLLKSLPLKEISCLLLTRRDDRDNGSLQWNVGDETDLRADLDRLRQLLNDNDTPRE